MKIFIIIFLITFFNLTASDEIIKDSNGNYFLMKDDGTFKKLPDPKPGNKYVIKKKIIDKKKGRYLKDPRKNLV